MKEKDVELYRKETNKELHYTDIGILLEKIFDFFTERNDKRVINIHTEFDRR